MQSSYIGYNLRPTHLCARVLVDCGSPPDNGCIILKIHDVHLYMYLTSGGESPCSRFASTTTACRQHCAFFVFGHSLWNGHRLAIRLFNIIYSDKNCPFQSCWDRVCSCIFTLKLCHIDLPNELGYNMYIYINVRGRVCSPRAGTKCSASDMAVFLFPALPFWRVACAGPDP